MLGAGVSGLTTALTLQRSGLATRIRTLRPPTETTSAVAAAVWHPYRAYPVERVAAWSLQSLEVFRNLAEDPAAGVSFRPLVELFRGAPPPPAWRAGLPGFAWHEAGALAGHHGLSDLAALGYRGGYLTSSPVAASPRYLPWLADRFRSAGGHIEVQPEPLPALADLLRPNRLLVCCLGMAAREWLGDDHMVPIRGQVVLVRAPEITATVTDDASEDFPIYVIPRGSDGEVVVGGTAEEGEDDPVVDPALTARILERAAGLVPAVADAQVLDARTGIRPGRSAVRVERRDLPGGSVIHNYGHGGAGFTLSWGCAREVARLAGVG